MSVRHREPMQHLSVRCQTMQIYEVLGVDGEWTQIQSGEVTGYVKTEYLVTGNEAAALAEQVKETVAKVTTTTLYVREEPNTDCSIVTSMPMGEELEVVEQLDGWVKVSIDSDEDMYPQTISRSIRNFRQL